MGFNAEHSIEGNLRYSVVAEGCLFYLCEPPPRRLEEVKGRGTIPLLYARNRRKQIVRG